MVDVFGTPYTDKLHVIERYRLLDYEAAKEGLERNARENFDLQRALPVAMESLCRIARPADAGRNVHAGMIIL
jgi:hypothetical protein